MSNSERSESVWPCIGFAHRGARGYAPENTLEAFTLALRLGATGLESDVWLTKDNIPVLDHDGLIRRRLRSRAIKDFLRADLPPHIPTLQDLLDLAPDTHPVSLDVKDENGFAVIYEVCVVRRPVSLSSIYLCHPNLQVLEDQASKLSGVNLVCSTRLSRLVKGPEMHAARMRESRIAVVNMPYLDWSGGLVALFHRFGIACFAWDCQQPEQIRAVKRMKIDGVYSDWPDRLADGLK